MSTTDFNPDDLLSSLNLDNGQQFVTEYLKDFNPTAAAVRMNLPASAAVTFMNDAQVQERISTHLRAVTMSSDSVMGLLSLMASGSFSDFISIDKDGHWELNLKQAVDKGSIRLVHKVSVDRTGKVTIELYNRLDILETLLKVYGKMGTGLTPKDGGAGGVGAGLPTNADEFARIYRSVKEFEAQLETDEP